MKKCTKCGKKFDDKINDGICASCRSQQRDEKRDFEVFNQKPCSRQEIEEIRFSDHMGKLLLNGFLATFAFCFGVNGVIYLSRVFVGKHADTFKIGASSGFAVFIVGSLMFYIALQLIVLFKPEKSLVVFNYRSRSLFTGACVGLLPGIFAGGFLLDIVHNFAVMPFGMAFIMTLFGFGNAYRCDKNDRESALKSFDLWKNRKISAMLVVEEEVESEKENQQRLEKENQKQLAHNYENIKQKIALEINDQLKTEEERRILKSLTKLNHAQILNMRKNNANFSEIQANVFNMFIEAIENKLQDRI